MSHGARAEDVTFAHLLHHPNKRKSGHVQSSDEQGGLRSNWVASDHTPALVSFTKVEVTELMSKSDAILVMFVGSGL